MRLFPQSLLVIPHLFPSFCPAIRQRKQRSPWKLLPNKFSKKLLERKKEWHGIFLVPLLFCFVLFCLILGLWAYQSVEICTVLLMSLVKIHSVGQCIWPWAFCIYYSVSIKLRLSPNSIPWILFLSKIF